MPELPEVETVCHGLRPVLEGRRLSRVAQRRPDLRFPFPPDLARRLEGRRILRIARRAKYILMHLEPAGAEKDAEEEVLLCHLGMSGRMTLCSAPFAPFEKHDHLVLETEDGGQVRFNDARRFGFVDLFPASAMDEHPMLKDLGPEPLGNAFNGPTLAAALKGKRTPIKAALLDQRVVAGLGNIYVCEALFDARLSPRRQAYTVQGDRADRLAAAVRAVLLRAIEAGGSSLRDYVQASGELGYFQHQWSVYGKEGEPCPRCELDKAAKTPCRIARIVQSGRSTFYCGRTQR